MLIRQMTASELKQRRQAMFARLREMAAGKKPCGCGGRKMKPIISYSGQITVGGSAIVEVISLNKT